MTEEHTPEEEVTPEGDAQVEPDTATLLAEKEAELEKTKAELEKLQNKEFNFKKLRDMSEEEKDKLTEREMELISRQEKLEEQQTQWGQKMEESNKNDALSMLVGNDDEMKKKALYHYDRIKDEAGTKDEIFQKMRDAVALAQSEKGGIDPISRAAGYHSSRLINTTSNNQKLSAEGKSLASRLGISEEDLKKRNLS